MPRLQRHLALALLLLAAPLANAAPQAGLSGAALVVHVQQANGGPLTVPAMVTLNSNSGSAVITGSTGQGGQAVFSALPAGDYTLEVRAPGYQTAREDMSILGSYGQAQSFIMMRPLGEANTSGGSTSSAPAISGKSRKEMDLAIAALGAGNVPDAAKHIAYSVKHSAKSADVQYIAGLCQMRLNDADGARGYLESAIKLQPNHLGAQLTLGSLFVGQNKLAEAIPHLDKALTLDRNSWRAHWLLGDALLRSNGDLQQARSHITQSIELGKEKSVGAVVTLAVIQARSGERDAARTSLEEFIRANPQNPSVPLATRLLGSDLIAANLIAVKKMSATAHGPSEAPTAGSGSGVSADASVVTSSGSAAVTRADVPPPAEIDSALLDPLMPPDVDAAIPAVTPGVSCALPQVLEGVAKRAVEFADSLERFTATENVVREELDTTGRARKSDSLTFQYIASLYRPGADSVVMQEMREGGGSSTDFPALFSVQGLPAHWLIFDHRYAGDYNFACEGLGAWHSEPAWQVHFEQKSDREGRILGWDVRNQSFPVSMKGRAWISTNSFRLLRIETDLVAPMDQIRLKRNHIAIDYLPVKSKDGKSELWLPANADVYTHFRGRLFRQQHAFSNFTLFNVDSNQKIKTPKVTEPPKPQP